ncbi:unnamed protein product [Lepidochelys olivacea]
MKRNPTLPTEDAEALLTQRFQEFSRFDFLEETSVLFSGPEGRTVIIQSALLQSTGQSSPTLGS